MDYGHMWTVIIVILVAINAFLVFRLLGKKVTKPNKFVKNHGLVVSKGNNIPRNLGYIFIAVGVALLGIGFLWMAPVGIFGPTIPGVLFLLVGLILFIGFYIQKLIASKKESSKYKD
jgi:flagellar biogenesis protein FliO